jgi:hypothetical protein
VYSPSPSIVHSDEEKCQEKRACKPREEMSVQGTSEEEVILAGAVVEVGVAVVSWEYVMCCFVGSDGGGSCNLGMEEGEEMKRGELGMELEPASIHI